MRRVTALILVGILVSAVPSAALAGAVTFNVVYQDVIGNTNTGFDDPTLGATRRATFESIFTYLNSVLDDSGSADINVNASQTDGSGFLASAGTAYFSSPNGFKPGIAFTHITTGTDVGGATPDIGVTFDFGYNWNSDTGAPTGSEYDLFTVALHELTHGLGFASLVTSTGVSGITGTNPGVFTTYDSFLELGNGTDLFSSGGSYDGTNLNLIGGDIYFNGANATAANSGNRVKIYAPGTFAPGSSISHVDTSGTGSLPNAVMQFSIGTGTTRRTYGAAEIGILEDLGYSITPIPEPTSIALAGFGLVLLGVAARKRRRKAGSSTIA